MLITFQRQWALYAVSLHGSEYEKKGEGLLRYALVVATSALFDSLRL